MKYTGLLHIYGPEAWHDDVFIVGTEEALVALRDGISAALDQGRGACLSFTSDGEGFAALILKESSSAIDNLALPYSDEIARDRTDLYRKHPGTLFVEGEYVKLIGRTEDR